EITDILVNGEQGVFIEKNGRLEPLVGVTLREQSLQVAARNIARALGDEINEESPMADCRLPDRSRITIVLPCVSMEGTLLAIREFQPKKYTLSELVRVGALPADLAQLLQEAVRRGESILISGPTGAGKTTLLTALAASIPTDDRIVVIEDTSEIQIATPNLVR